MRVYKFYRFKWKDQWYQQTEQEQQTILAGVNNIRDLVGGHTIVSCESGWSSEGWNYFGVEEYPSMDAVLDGHRRLTELNWFQYVSSESMLGTSLDPFSPVVQEKATAPVSNG